MDKTKKIYNLLGLAKRSGRLKSGEFMTEGCIKDGKGRLVIVALDASDNTKKNFTDMCNFYQVPLIIMGTKDEIGHAIGCEFRASVVINDDGFADSILKLDKETEV